MTAGRTNSEALSHHWGTPRNIFEAARKTLGSIELDPCSNRWSIVEAQTRWSLPDNDGLRQAWSFPTIYVNPPYGSDRERGTRISHWLKKCAEANSRFDAEVVALVPVAVNTRHWKDSIWTAAHGICFLYEPRVRFLVNGADTGKGAPMACATIYWGKDFARFAEAFGNLGAVVDVSSVQVPGAAKLNQVELRLVASG